MTTVAPSYNTVYEKLVLRDDDLVGLISYALYKQRKRAWIVDFTNQKGRRPNADEQYSYLIGESTSSRLGDYRQQAEAILGSYADSILKSATPEIQKAASRIGSNGPLPGISRSPAGSLQGFHTPSS